MSIVYLEEFELNENNNIIIRDDPTQLIIISFIALIFYSIYLICYFKVVYFYRNPNPLIFYKITSEAILAFHFIVVYLNFKFTNCYQEIIVYYTSLLIS